MDDIPIHKSYFIYTSRNVNNEIIVNTYHVLAQGRSCGLYAVLLMVNFCGPPPPDILANPPNGTREL